MRFPHSLEVRGHGMTAAGAVATTPVEFEGRVQNISEGGISLLSESSLTPSSFVRCSIQVPDLPVAVPTLMQVRWSVARRGNKSKSYLIGLLFVG